MKKGLFVALFNKLAKRKPFEPFTLELINGSRLEVNHPEAVTFYEAAFVYSSTRGIRSVAEYESVVRFIDATGSV